VIGAGIPRGRMIEVMGENSTAKSAFGYHAIGAFQRAGGKCILIDSEAKADSESNDEKRKARYQANSADVQNYYRVNRYPR